MEGLRRKFKIFWTEHGTPILFYTILLIAVILVVQLLNKIAIERTKKEGYNTKENEIKQSTVVYKENKENTKLINKFIEYCKSNQQEQAYNLLSENCKKDLYPTIKDFSKEFYDKFFSDKKEIKVKYDTNNDVYKILFYEDILETGQMEDRNYIDITCKIEEEILETKIYLNNK